MTDVMTAIALRRTQSLTAIVHREVERMILSGELKPGQRVNEQALAGRLGVSRGPIREALRALERSGLLTSVVNQGVFVREIADRLLQAQSAIPRCHPGLRRAWPREADL